VTVTSQPGQPYTLHSFEDGTDGWVPSSFQTNAGSVAVSTDWSTDGEQSLEITAADGGWFGVSLSPAQDWTGRTQLMYQVETLGQKTSTAAVVQVGASYSWWQSSLSQVPANTAMLVTIDLTQTLGSCFSGGGTYYLDQVQIQ
jgi:mannan endo-1,4-beta-mannosidase